MSVPDVYLEAKGVCGCCKFPMGNHRGDCPRIEVIAIRKPDIDTLRIVRSTGVARRAAVQS